MDNEGGNSPLAQLMSKKNVASPVGGRSPGGLERLGFLLESEIQSESSPDSSPRNDLNRLRSPEIAPLGQRDRRPESPETLVLGDVQMPDTLRPIAKPILRPPHKATAAPRLKSGHSIVWADSAGRSLLSPSHKILAQNATKLSASLDKAAGSPRPEETAEFEVGRLQHRSGSPMLEHDYPNEPGGGGFDARRLLPRTGSPPLTSHAPLTRTDSDESDGLAQAAFEAVLPSTESLSSEESPLASSSGSPTSATGGRWDRVIGRF